MIRSLCFFLFFFIAAFCSCTSRVNHTDGTSSANVAPDSSNHKAVKDSLAEAFGFTDLQTDFSKHSIPLDSIYSGGPAKNGIPAIDFPEFFTVEKAKGFLSEPDYGILLQANAETKYYPFPILNWHEVVNDKIDGAPVVVTFCPLCGSAIAFSRIIDGDTLTFGVSGKLYESNLLMFDDKSESLWSQAMGQSVVGQYTGKKLELINTVVTSFGDVVEYYPDAKVLSPNTGFDRNYTQHPYADYMNSEELYFPVSKKSDRFAAKDIFYVVPFGNNSIAFNWLPLLKKGQTTVNTDHGTVVVKVEKSIPRAYLKETGAPLPAYFSFWFSWYAIYGDKGSVWDGNR